MGRNYIFDDIEEIEEIGEFNEEYVYDVEVDDDTHTFISNDILVHNSLFVSFEPAISNSTWKNLIFNNDYLSSIDKKFIILVNTENYSVTTNNPNCLGIANNLDELEELIKLDYELLLFDGEFIKNKSINKLIKNGVFTSEIKWNWSSERDYIQGIDKFRYEGYFIKKLEEYAESFGVENKENFELEKISKSVINLAKKKYIMDITHEDGIDHDSLSYIYPKGVELVRSSTPAFARAKIMNIVKYLFESPDSFNIKDLLKLVKQLRKEFELADVDDISMQTSVSNYATKMIDDTKLPLQFVSGAHFAVKASGHYNYLLNQNKDLQSKYEFIKSGTKIKYYYCKNKIVNDIFAYIRGSYPIEFSPEIDYDEQFMKSILSPINSIIEPLGLPEITKRLSVVMNIFSGF
jgi:hypothetical protein